MRVWVDSSTLIALDAAGQISVLRELLGRIAITKEVANEVLIGRESRLLREAVGDWIEVVDVKGDRRRWISIGLDRGEASLFLTPLKDRLVLDEVPARTVAEAEGRQYSVLLGLLLEGVRQDRPSVTHAREIVRELVRGGFRVATDLYDEVMRELQESD